MSQKVVDKNNSRTIPAAVDKTAFSPFGEAGARLATLWQRLKTHVATSQLRKAEDWCELTRLTALIVRSRQQVRHVNTPASKNQLATALSGCCGTQDGGNVFSAASVSSSEGDFVAEVIAHAQKVSSSPFVPIGLHFLQAQLLLGGGGGVQNKSKEAACTILDQQCIETALSVGSGADEDAHRFFGTSSDASQRKLLLEVFNLHVQLLLECNDLTSTVVETYMERRRTLLTVAFDTSFVRDVEQVFEKHFSAKSNEVKALEEEKGKKNTTTSSVSHGTPFPSPSRKSTAAADDERTLSSSSQGIVGSPVRNPAMVSPTSATAAALSGRRGGAAAGIVGKLMSFLNSSTGSKVTILGGIIVVILLLLRQYRASFAAAAGSGAAGVAARGATRRALTL